MFHVKHRSRGEGGQSRRLCHVRLGHHRHPTHLTRAVTVAPRDHGRIDPLPRGVQHWSRVGASCGQLCGDAASVSRETFEHGHAAGAGRHLDLHATHTQPVKERRRPPFASRWITDHDPTSLLINDEPSCVAQRLGRRGEATRHDGVGGFAAVVHCNVRADRLDASAELEAGDHALQPVDTSSRAVEQPQVEVGSCDCDDEPRHAAAAVDAES